MEKMYFVLNHLYHD